MLADHFGLFVGLLFVPITAFACWRGVMALARSRLPTIRKSLVVATELGIILEAKGDIEEICGWPAAELVGQNITVFIPRALREAHMEGMEAYRHSGEGPVIGKTLEMSALGPDDTLYPVWLTVFGYEKYSEFVYGLLESRS